MAIFVVNDFLRLLVSLLAFPRQAEAHLHAEAHRHFPRVSRQQIVQVDSHAADSLAEVDPHAGL